MDRHLKNRRIFRRSVVKRWTADEDSRLRALVVGSGKSFTRDCTQSQSVLTAANTGKEGINWVNVSAYLSGRTNKESRRRWNKIKDNFNRGMWSWDEDESLRIAVERFGQRWTLVTKVVKTRSPDRT